MEVNIFSCLFKESNRFGMFLEKQFDLIKQLSVIRVVCLSYQFAIEVLDDNTWVAYVQIRRMNKFGLFVQSVAVQFWSSKNVLQGLQEIIGYVICVGFLLFQSARTTDVTRRSASFMRCVNILLGRQREYGLRHDIV